MKDPIFDLSDRKELADKITQLVSKARRYDALIDLASQGNLPMAERLCNAIEAGNVNFAEFMLDEHYERMIRDVPQAV